MVKQRFHKEEIGIHWRKRNEAENFIEFWSGDEDSSLQDINEMLKYCKYYIIHVYDTCIFLTGLLK